MQYNFDEIIERRNSGSFKWDTNLERFGREDVIPFWVADMDFPAPPPVMEAMRKRLNHPVFGYSARGEQYYSAILDWLKKRHQWEVKREWLSFSPPGVVSGIHLLINILTEPGDQVVVQTPAYSPLLNVVSGNSRVVVRNDLVIRGGRYSIDFDNLESGLSSRTKLLILCSPHNPSGRVWSRKELMRIFDVCSKHNILVISDEIHADFVYKGYKHIPYGSLSEEAALNSITFFSASKTFNISGLQLATMVIADEDLRRRFEEARDIAQMNLDNTFGEVALQAAYRRCSDWLDQLLIYLEENISFVETFVKENLPTVKMIRPEGTYLVWLDMRELGMSSQEISRLLVEEAGVALFEGREFGEEREGFFRMNIACPESLLREGLERMGKALNGRL